MVNFGTGVLMLTLSCIGDGNHFGMGPHSLSITDGYFIVNFDPMLPSIHSIDASSWAMPLFVTRLYTLATNFGWSNIECGPHLML